MHGVDARTPRHRHAHPPPPRSSLSEPQLYALSAACLAVAGGAVALAVSYVACPTFLAPLCRDTHYKYLVPLLVPVTVWFAIANWVGWQYFRLA